MVDNFIPQMEPWFGKEEKEALSEYMDSGGWLTEFRKTAEFEQKIATFTNAKHCVVTNNGTVSLTLAALAVGVQAGDEVIVPNYTMIATPNSIKIFGAEPVFVDVEPETLCIDFEKVKDAVSKKTKAVMLVSANGRYPKTDIDDFLDFCQAKEIVLIEDAATALGSFYPDGRHIGTAGTIGSFSFSMPKIISTGQGGALITKDDKVVDRIRRLKDFGRIGGGTDIHDTIGYNFKFTELQACVGIEQMKKLPWRVNRKKDIYRLYQEQLANVSEVKIFKQDLKNTTPWFIDVLVNRREELMDYLRKHNIGSRVMYPPINKQRAYNVPGEHPVSNLVGRQGLWLPSASQLKDEQIARITDSIREFYGTP